MPHIMEYHSLLQCILFLLVVLLFSCGSVMGAIREWSVIVDGDLQTAHEVANENGFQCMGQIGNLPNHYRFHLLPEDITTAKELVELRLANHNKVLDFTEQIGRVRVKTQYSVPTDKMWSSQWSLKNKGQSGGPAGLDLNVERAWLQGLDGSDVLVGVVDDGVQWDNNEIRANYDAHTSYNFVNNTKDPSPDPNEHEAGHGTSCAGEIAMVKNDYCGVGVAYNSKISGLRIGLGPGYYLTDAQEACAVGHMDNDIMIYSNSWGPANSYHGPGPLLQLVFKRGTEMGRDGKGSIYVFASGNGGMNHDSCAANGYVNSIYTIAIGSADQNGKQAIYDESCTSKMAVTYSFNSNHWNKNDTTHQIVTIDMNNQCIDTFTGTSASAPLVSGAIALVLERNPNLSWRDIQYLIVYTSDTTKLSDPSSASTDAWTTNGAGLKVSSEFGFGAIDAEAMVTRAKHWTNVPVQIHSSFSVMLNNIPYTLHRSPNGIYYKEFRLTFEITKADTSITFLEHVAVTVSFTMAGLTQPTLKLPGIECHVPSFAWNYIITTKNRCDYKYQWTKRGGISIALISPAGTISLLLPNDYCDICQDGLQNWEFMSVHHWGENPVGTWTVVIDFISLSEYLDISGIQTLDIYGVTKKPESVQRIPSSCDPACVRGCAASGSQYCDSCKNYRDPVTLECLDLCNKIPYNGYCLESDHVPHHPTSSTSTATTNPGISSGPTPTTSSTASISPSVTTTINPAISSGPAAPTTYFTTVASVSPKVTATINPGISCDPTPTTYSAVLTASPSVTSTNLHTKMDYDILYISLGSFTGVCIIVALVLVVLGVCVRMKYRRRSRSTEVQYKQFVDFT